MKNMPANPSDTAFDHCLSITRACGDATRLRILLLLADGELCLCQLTAVMDLAASTLSEHLRRLREAGLIEIRREGKWRFYQLPKSSSKTNAAASSFLQWIQQHAAEDPWTRRESKRIRKIRCTPVEQLSQTVSLGGVTSK